VARRSRSRSSRVQSSYSTHQHRIRWHILWNSLSRPSTKSDCRKSGGGHDGGWYWWHERVIRLLSHSHTHKLQRTHMSSTKHACGGTCWFDSPILTAPYSRSVPNYPYSWHVDTAHVEWYSDIVMQWYKWC
jgi:hypothetical protein